MYLLILLVEKEDKVSNNLTIQPILNLANQAVTDK